MRFPTLKEKSRFWHLSLNFQEIQQCRARVVFCRLEVLLLLSHLSVGATVFSPHSLTHTNLEKRNLYSWAHLFPGIIFILYIARRK